MIKFIKNSTSVWVVLLVFLASSWSLLNPKLFRVHDYIHAARIVEMAQGLADGQFPVRWSQNFGYGYGMPLFNFYAPLPSYMGGLMYLAGFNVEIIIKFLFWFSSLVSIAGAYYLGRKMFGRSAGLVMAASFGLFPYRAVNLFVRGAVSESWGMMMFPWILLGVIYFFKKDVLKKWWVLFLSLVTLMLSHNLSTLMFVPVSFIFALCYGLREMIVGDHKFGWLARRTLFMTGVYLLSGLAAAFYMIPAVLEKDLTQIESILGGYFSYSHHLLYIRQFFRPFWGYGGSQWGVDDGISFFWGYGQWLGLVLAGLVFLVAVRKFSRKHFSKKNRVWSSFIKSDLYWPVIFSTLLVLVSYLTLEKARWIWETVELLSFIQFPWRWLAVAAVIISLLIGWGVSRIENIFTRGMVAGLLILITMGNAWYFRPESYLEKSSDFYYTDPGLIRTEMSGILPDFIPIDLDLPVESAVDLVANGENFVSLNIQKDVSHQKLVSYQADNDQILIFNIAYFPGWQAQVDGVIVPVEVVDGLVSVPVVAGSHQVGVFFAKTQVRAVSELLSFVAWFIVLTLLINTKDIRPKSKISKLVEKLEIEK